MCHSVLNGQKWKDFCVLFASVFGMKNAFWQSRSHQDLALGIILLERIQMENMKSFQPVVLLKRTSPVAQAFEDLLANPAETSAKAATNSKRRLYALSSCCV
ncbi:hypothetical protein HOLleu_26369 [Holothuria leucospilota]|uniref:Uncharacterized protein n=1 Tax=Holothuria leucospilota TaxID=206669 RepID=A0A9Q1H1I7_HOLLE|nr:hypothetical protein HOLleu_26369 [Holothuria leucospilota]